MFETFETFEKWCQVPLIEGDADLRQESHNHGCRSDATIYISSRFRVNSRLVSYLTARKKSLR